jgi:hypothetical protein
MWNGRIILDGPTGEVFAKKEALARTFLRPPVAAEVADCLRDLGIPGNIVTAEGLLRTMGRKD